MRRIAELFTTLLILTSMTALADPTPLTLVNQKVITDDHPAASVYGPVTPGYELSISSLTFSNINKAEGAWIAVRVVKVTAPGGGVSDCTSVSPRSVIAELHRVRFAKEGTIHLTFPIPIVFPVVEPRAGELWCVTAELQEMPPSISIPRGAEILVTIQGSVTHLTTP